MGSIGAAVGRWVAAHRACSIVVVVAVLLFAFGPDAARAATPAGTIEGQAKDALERPLAAVQLRLETSEGQVVGRAMTAEDGHFAFTEIAPGTYVVVGEKEGFDAATAAVTLSGSVGANADLTLASRQALDLSLVAKRLEEARLSIQPEIGASTYEISSQAIESQPRGENNPLNQVLLQAPGVSQDSFSLVHVRNEHANVQYRINGIILPEGVSLFGQSLSPRFASSVNLIDGALPAQYGLRTAGIVDIETKSGGFGEGGSVGMYGGSDGWLQPSAEVRGSFGRFNYFVTGDYLQNNRGIESATAGKPLHDDTQQGHGFGYFEYLLDATSKLSAVAGSFTGQFQIPNQPGVPSAFTVNGLSTFDSTTLDERQRESNQFGVLSYLKTGNDFTAQISAFTRYSSLHFTPDTIGDLVFNGIAQGATRNNLANGLQAEGSYILAPTNTLRAGVIVTGERSNFDTNSQVLPAVGGVQTSDVPFGIVDNLGKTAWTYSVYLQDEWRVLPTVTVNGGIRFDVYNGFTSENQVSPRLNVVWQATPSTTVHAGYAHYFTPPPLENLSVVTINKFLNTTAEPAVTQDSPVRPERADYVDVGATQEFLPGLKVGLDGYLKYARDLIDEGQFGAPIILTPFNYDRAHNWGVELTPTYTVGDFSAYGNLAIAQQKATNIVSAQFNFSPSDLAYIANHYIYTDHDQLVTASAGVAYLWRGTRASLDLLVGSGLRATVTEPNDTSLGLYEQVNFSLTHRFSLPKGKLVARFDVINLFDETYQIRNGTGVGVFAPQYGPRRGFYGGLSYEF